MLTREMESANGRDFWDLGAQWIGGSVSNHVIAMGCKCSTINTFQLTSAQNGRLETKKKHVNLYPHSHSTNQRTSTNNHSFNNRPKTCQLISTHSNHYPVSHSTNQRTCLLISIHLTDQDVSTNIHTLIQKTKCQLVSIFSFNKPNKHVN